MVKNKTALRHLLIELLVGLVLMAVVFAIATSNDVKATELRLSTTVNYIKEQCNGYGRLNLASEAKSLMRVMQGAKEVDAHLRYERALHDAVPDAALLQTCAEESYLTGVILLDADGTVLQEYHADKLGAAALRDALSADALLDTAQIPEKLYAVRTRCEDGSYVDIAAASRDDTVITIVYYHTPSDYVTVYNLSVETLLTGYSTENDGTIVVSDGVDIISSNDPSLVGKSTDDLAILRHIRAKGQSGKLTHTHTETSALAQNFGLMEHGRDYYIYAYLPERNVFRSTVSAMIYSLIIYIMVLAVINGVRRRTEQTYLEAQQQVQQKYTVRLQSKNEELKAAVERADRANAAKTSFLSRMSHDIRTPLNGIIGLLQINAAHPDDEMLVRSNQKKMMIAAKHLLSLINDILQMSKLESGEVVLSHEVMDMQELSAEVLSIVEQRAAEAGVTLVHDRAAERTAYNRVYGSPLHVRQIFLNIYSNCIKYNKVGGTVSTTCECLGVQGSTVTYRWVIADTGIGMSEEYLKHIFDAFSQERTDARSVYKGTGLGMAIVKNLIDKMGGTIEVASVEGEGSTFTITLPFELAPEEEPVAETLTLPEAPAGSGGIQGMRLLLAEDNALNAEIAETLLEDQGASVVIAEDGRQAVELFSEHPAGTYDAILMDVMMPGMDGLTATRTIRALNRPDAGTIPILAMTANAYAEDAKQCLDAGMNAHLSKPLQMDKVIAALEKYRKA